MLFLRALCPTAILVDVVFKRRALAPIAILSFPETLHNNTCSPIPILFEPIVLLHKDKAPIAVFAFLFSCLLALSK